jgi:hypothetical protein
MNHHQDQKGKIDETKGEPALNRSGEPKIEWAKHLWDEWKYRHETWHKTFYRSLWFVVTLAIIPWIPKRIKGIEFTFPSQPVIQGAYALLPLVLFLATAFQLAREHTHLIEIEDKLQQTRDGEAGDKYGRPNRGLISVFFDKRPAGGSVAARSSRWWRFLRFVLESLPPAFWTAVYLAIGISLWAVWACVTFGYIPLPWVTRLCGFLK